MGKRAQNLKRRQAKPRSEIQIWEERGFGKFRFEFSETKNKFRENLFHRLLRLRQEAIRPWRKTWNDEKWRRTSDINLSTLTNSQFRQIMNFEPTQSDLRANRALLPSKIEISGNCAWAAPLDTNGTCSPNLMISGALDSKWERNQSVYISERGFQWKSWESVLAEIQISESSTLSCNSKQVDLIV